jgi:DNA-binding HxlR family transcriptional regulator
MADIGLDVGFDLEQYRLDPDYYEMVETKTSRSIKEAKRRASRKFFVPPVPLEDVYRWQSLGPNCLAIMLLLKRWAAMHRSNVAWERGAAIGEDTLAFMNISAWQRDNALKALEKAGLIRVDRHRGRSPRIWPADGDRSEGSA